jgi:hypothetical protein
MSEHRQNIKPGSPNSIDSHEAVSLRLISGRKSPALNLQSARRAYLSTPTCTCLRA